MITAGSAIAMVFPAPGMDNGGKYRSFCEIEYVKICTDQELYALKVCGRLIYSGIKPIRYITAMVEHIPMCSTIAVI